MSNVKCIAEHSVDLSLINRSSKVLDLGCRNFGWARAMLEYIDGIMCVDADDDIQEPEGSRINFIHGAVCVLNKPEMIEFVKFGNGTGNYVNDGRLLPTGANIVDVLSISLNEIFEVAGKPDLIKFDIESMEMAVIASLRQPPAQQLSIEWHMHLGVEAERIKCAYDHLKWLGYKCVFEDYSDKHGAGFNIWDSLFILQ